MSSVVWNNLSKTEVDTQILEKPRDLFDLVRLTKDITREQLKNIFQLSQSFLENCLHYIIEKYMDMKKDKNIEVKF